MNCAKLFNRFIYLLGINAQNMLLWAYFMTGKDIPIYHMSNIYALQLWSGYNI